MRLRVQDIIRVNRLHDSNRLNRTLFQNRYHQRSSSLKIISNTNLEYAKCKNLKLKFDDRKKDKNGNYSG